MSRRFSPPNKWRSRPLTLNASDIPSIEAAGLRPAVLIERDAPASTNSFAALLDGLSSVLRRADESAARLAIGGGSVAEASIARAKADVLLEVAAVAASRVSGAISTLLQTQV